ncbi:copper amine oxidase N-terminal domain-containing protein [uncultured Intestinimonas sp.]|uniref:copper amine oxidase N-terminal domain-containing protein n=1 Tax=uncultured Intestinimonas sp. TaxID=1689265 RepID=UPI0025E89F24|nr:copper amine oxidase N-terminal domain-containing protein [uncultured Intestinimonas sp.]
MKNCTKRFLALGTALALTSGFGGAALAAEPEPVSETSAQSAITVQLDGAPLTFTDAAPQVKDQRTFLPFRAVFEAMGALVTYDPATSQVRATRDGTTVTMTLGSVEATVETDGAVAPLTMDVAPYAENDRTYVPVRFAAQALGCAVGWDQAAQTVILVDTDKVVDEAMAEHQYTTLEKYLAYAQKYNEGIWDMDAQFTGDMTMLQAGPAAFTGSMEGTTSDGTAMDVSMDMTMDLAALVEGMSQDTEGEVTLTDEDRAMLDAMKDEGMHIEFRGDVAAGQLYFYMEVPEALGLPADTWYEMDLSALYGSMGIDWTALMGAARELDMHEMLKTSVQAMPLTDSTTAYGEVTALVDGMAACFSDEGFVQGEDGRLTASYSESTEGATSSLTFSLEMDGDQVVGYSMDMSSSMEGLGEIMTMTASMDRDDQMSATMTMDMASLMTMTMEITGGYAPGTQAPETEPPAGAAVVDLMEQMAAETAAEALPESASTQA